MPQVMTVRQTLIRAKEDGYPISEYSLRRWIKSGEIPCRKAGTKALIYYPHIVAFFEQTNYWHNK